MIKVSFQTFVYNDLFFYNISNNTWTVIKAPGAPPPRCGHQMVATSANKGQLWIFGGEFASPTQSQFYHYRDLWLYSLTTKHWEKITGDLKQSTNINVYQTNSTDFMYSYYGNNELQSL